MAPPPHTHDSIREDNEERQRRVKWETLAYYQGSLEHMYLLAVHSQVEKVKITNVPLLSAKIQWMHSVVRNLAPTKLCLEVSVPDNADVELLDLMPRDVVRPLRYLEIKLLRWIEGKKLQVRWLSCRPTSLVLMNLLVEPTPPSVSSSGHRTHACNQGGGECHHDIQESPRH